MRRHQTIAERTEMLRYYRHVVNPRVRLNPNYFGQIRCDGCGGRCRHGRAGPMLHDDLWRRIANRRDHLCFRCTGKRLGRPITERDLKPCLQAAESMTNNGRCVSRAFVNKAFKVMMENMR